MAIIRNEALHKQVARAMRQSISSGEWPPGTKVPTETELATLYGVSRPTVRLAVAALRTEGQLDVTQGRGTFVRATAHGPTSTVDQAITQHGSRFETSTDSWFSDSEQPTVYRTRTDTVTGPWLDMETGELLIGCDRLIVAPNDGTRALHRLWLPMERVESTPLAKTPAVTPAKAYAILSTAGHQLTWREQVSARVPQPDERETLGLTEASVLLVVHRVTCDRADGRPLMLEETRLGAETAALAYAIEARREPKRPRQAATC
ncbi:GntR family transcriptional regulator [Kitasatospora sp. NPDC059571]|uniref:GntR family transcriptional regulator n=1 Tax=Kitasatospora sp. NPDC059571 TaxID=3346871 RepID=UPI00369ED2D2